jgi:hypothetical protein
MNAIKLLTALAATIIIFGSAAILCKSLTQDTTTVLEYRGHTHEHQGQSASNN